MDAANLILTQPVPPPSPLGNSASSMLNHIEKYKSCAIDGVSQEQKKQIAKDFESVLIGKLLDEMKNTIGDWGFEKNGACKQVQGIFWLYLARDIANNGGFGLWKDIYQTLTNCDRTDGTTESLDKNI